MNALTAAMGYDPGAWHDLFVKAGGAGAALAGLIFVAVSLNQAQVLANSNLPLIAVRTLTVLLGLVIACVFGLTPGQPAMVLGIELLVLGIVLLATVLISTARSNSGRLLDQLDDWVVGSLATIPMPVAGLTLLLGSGGGLYWLTAESVTALFAAVYYAWFLLVVIRR